MQRTHSSGVHPLRWNFFTLLCLYEQPVHMSSRCPALLPVSFRSRKCLCLKDLSQTAHCCKPCIVHFAIILTEQRVIRRQWQPPFT